MSVKIGSYVKLKEPVWTKTFGQGKPPLGMEIAVGDKKYKLEWNKVYKVSESCDSENRVGDMETKAQYDLLHIDFVTEHKKQFEIIN